MSEVTRTVYDINYLVNGIRGRDRKSKFHCIDLEEVDVTANAQFNTAVTAYSADFEKKLADKGFKQLDRVVLKCTWTDIGEHMRRFQMFDERHKTYRLK